MSDLAPPPPGGADLDSADDLRLLTTARAADTGEELKIGPEADAAAAIAPDPGKPWRDGAIFYLRIARTLLAEKHRAHWTDERLAEFAAELANCAIHYSWKWGGAINHPVARLLAAGSPLVWPMIEPHVMPLLARINADDTPPPPADTQPGGGDDTIADSISAETITRH